MLARLLAACLIFPRPAGRARGGAAPPRPAAHAVAGAVLHRAGARLFPRRRHRPDVPLLRIRPADRGRRGGGDIDVGVTALTGGFFNLAEKGDAEGDRRRPARAERLRGLRRPGVQRGVRRRPDIARQAARPQLRHHAIRLVVPLHARPHRRGGGLRPEVRHAAPGAARSNMLAAVAAGQVDATIAIASRPSRWPRRAGADHRLGGDIVPYQITAVFTTRR